MNIGQIIINNRFRFFFIKCYLTCLTVNKLNVKFDLDASVHYYNMYNQIMHYYNMYNQIISISSADYLDPK